MLTFNFVIHILAGLIIFSLLGLYLVERRALKSTRRTSSRLIHKLHLELADLKRDEAAWEQGLEDTTEIYEQQFLTLNENATAREIKIELLTEDLRKALAINYIHQTHCLPILDFDSLVDDRIKTTEDAPMNPYIEGYLKDDQEDEIQTKLKQFLPKRE